MVNEYILKGYVRSKVNLTNQVSNLFEVSMSSMKTSYQLQAVSIILGNLKSKSDDYVPCAETKLVGNTQNNLKLSMSQCF